MNLKKRQFARTYSKSRVFSPETDQIRASFQHWILTYSYTYAILYVDELGKPDIVTIVPFSVFHKNRQQILSEHICFCQCILCPVRGRKLRCSRDRFSFSAQCILCPVRGRKLEMDAEGDIVYKCILCPVRGRKLQSGLVWDIK